MSYELKIKEATAQGYAIAKEGDSINLSQPNSKTRRGRVGGGMANTLDTQMQQYTIVKENMKGELKIYQPGHGYNPGGVLDGKVHPSLNANTNGSHKQYLMPGTRIRRLTPVECARLQGFPDDWHKGVSDSQAYRCYGNAVTVKIVELIARRLKC